MGVRGWGAGRDAVFYLQWIGKAWVTGSSHRKCGKKNIPRKENSKCKGPGEEGRMGCPRTTKEASVAVTQRERVVKREV